MTGAARGSQIDGREFADGDVFASINPSDTADTVGYFTTAGRTESKAAVRAAARAFLTWSQTGAEARKAVLDHIGAELIRRRDEIGRLVSREEGKPLAEGVGEVTRAGQFFQYFGAEALRQVGDSVDSVRPGVRCHVTREPLGVIAIVTPWNFPVAVAAWKIAPALAFGNTVVWKPSELVPASACALADIIAGSGLPPGAFNMLLGPGETTGAALVQDAGVAAVSFTGSVSTGRGIARAAIDNMTRIQLEMGSKNPLIVLDDADLDVAVSCAVNGAFFGTGQKCTASSRLIVQAGIHDAFVARLREVTEALVVGHALHADTQIGPVVDGRQLERNLGYLELADAEGATLACGGTRVRRDTEGFYMRPALLVDTDNAMRINREEMFGPIACVIRVADYDEALATANDSEFGLSAGIVTTSLRHASHFERHSQSGCVMVNLPTAGTDYHVPFGGRKASSYGPREQGQYAAEFYTTIKTAYLNPG